jgi:hypothetical protein
MSIITVPVRELRAGDKFGTDTGWTAEADAKTDSTGTVVKVEHYPDGALGFRQWDNPDQELTVERTA